MLTKNHIQRSLFALFGLVFFLGHGQEVKAQTWFEKAKAATDKNQKVIFFTRSIEEERQDQYIYYSRAWAYYGVQKYERSIRDFQKAIDMEGNYEHTYFLTGIGWCRYALGEYPASLSYAQKSIEVNEKYPESWNVKGWAELELKRFEDAVASFTRYLSLAENKFLGHSSRSLAYSKLGQFQKSIDDCDKALAIQSDNDIVLERKAYCMMKMGNKQAAIDLIREKIEYKKEDPISLSQIGNLFFRNEDFKDAIRYHTDAIALYNHKIREDKDFKKIFRDDIYDIYTARGDAYYALVDYQRALADYKRATIIKPEDHRAWFEIGQLQTYQKNWSEGAKAYEEAFSRRPDLKFGWVNLGFCYDNLHQPHRAIDAYTRGIANNPKVGLLYNNRGYGYLELQKYDLALADLEMAIEVEPEIVMSHVSLGEFFYDTKNYQDAISKFSKALKMEDGSDQAYTAAYYTRGMCYFMLEDFAKAKADFIKAIKLTNDHVLAHEKLGITYYKLDEQCKAYKILKKTLNLEKTIPFPKKQAKEAPTYLGKMTKNPC